MAWFKSFSDGKGGFNTFDWSLGDSLTYGIINFLFMIAVCLLFLAILPILLIFFYMFCNVKEKKITAIVSIILSAIFLINYSVGYAFWDAANCNELCIDINKSLATIHASLILMNIVLYVSAKQIDDEVSESFGKPLLFIALIFLVIRIVLYPNLYNKVSNMRAETKYSTELPKN